MSNTSSIASSVTTKSGNYSHQEKCRSYGFTLMNYSEENFSDSKKIEGAKFCEWGKEIAPTTGTPHAHFFIYFIHAIGIKGANFRIHKYIKKAADIKPLWNTEGWRTYIKKDTIYDSWGEEPNQGKRSDINDVRDMIKNGAGMKEITEKARSYQSMKMAELYFKYHEPVRNWKTQVWWFWGPTGSGKSKAAYEELGYECYTAMSTAKWWDGYDGQENVLIDDMRRDFCKFHELLRLLDRYPLRIETKGGSRQFVAKRIIITSCYPPDYMYDTREDIDQLLRRIELVKKFGTEVEVRIIEPRLHATEGPPTPLPSVAARPPRGPCPTKKNN